MRSLFLVVSAVGVIGIMALYALPQGNPRGVAKIAQDGKSISIEYGRPSLKGRTLDDLLLQLKPPDAQGLHQDYWRLGADKSTTFSTAADLEFGEVEIPKGRYSLWAEREADVFWNLIFNKQHDQWGTQHDPSQDFASVPLTETQAATSADILTILLLKKDASHGIVVIHWGDLKLSADFGIR